jgi:hypothetical protein
VADTPEDGVHRLDVGALRIPALEGLQVQFQVSEASGQPLSVVVTDGRSAMELQVFAAPKSRGLWDEVRAEILDALRAGSGAPQTATGRYGTEIRMRLPAPNQGQPVPGRMVGIDGPRWFLRAVFTGPAAQNPAAAPRLDETLRRLVVVRGEDAMPVRDPLPLRLPREVTEHADGAPAAVESTRPAMPVPGVRISETR